MSKTSNIVIGLLATFLGIMMITWVIPAQTIPAIFASVPSGFYPNFTSVMLICSGIALAISGFFSPTSQTDNTSTSHFLVRFFAALILLVTAMLFTPIIGFVPAGIIICLVTLLLMRENRKRLIAAICLIAPFLIWAAFELLLGRPLP